MSPHSMYNGLSPYYMSATEISTYWSTQNNTNLSPTIVSVPNTNTLDGSTVEKEKLGKTVIIVSQLLN